MQNDPIFFDRLIIVDEKQIYFKNDERKCFWCESNTPLPQQVYNNIFKRKVILCIFWGAEGVIYYELKNCETVNKANY